MRLLLSPSPRRLMLATDAFVLVFSPPPADSRAPDVVVEFLPTQEVDYEGTVALHAKVAGCLGVLRLGDGKLSRSMGASCWRGAGGPGSH